MSIKKRLSVTAGTAIRDNHLNPMVRVGARICEKYLYYYRNERNWNLQRNGESLLLQKIAERTNGSSGHVILDVGANKGAYTLELLKIMPQARIHCFEIVPQTRNILRSNLSNYKNVVISNFGLSNKRGTLKVSYNPKFDDESREHNLFSKSSNQVIDCEVFTGDQYLKENGIGKIELLKIDCEGHDLAVLEGFKDSINKEMINIIQFEYGSTWMAPRRFLYEAYNLLAPAGYTIGRLHPDGVLFKTYDRFNDERFYMGNYVAVHKNHNSIAEALKLQLK